MKRKIVSVLLSILSLTCLSSCSLPERVTSLFSGFTSQGVVGGYELHAEDKRVIIIPKAFVWETVLLDYMQEIQLKGGFSFEIQNGMITSINGKANAADFSACWMLYTSDEEFSNHDWGTIEYDGKTLGSAILGAESLPITEGAIYVWEYCTF